MSDSKNTIEGAANALADVFKDNDLIRGVKTFKAIKGKLKSMFLGVKKKK